MPLLPIVPPVLAAITQDDQATLLLFIVAGLLAALKAADMATSLWQRFKKSPPDHVLYATKAELAEVRAAVASSLGKMEASLESHNSTLTRTLGDINRAIGHLEGRTENKT